MGVIRGVCMKAAGLLSEDKSTSPLPTTPSATPSATLAATPIVLGSKDSIFMDYSSDEMFSNASDGVGVAIMGKGVVSEDSGVGVMQRFEVQVGEGVAYEGGADMLDQLAMDEELSDARLVGVADQKTAMIGSQDFSTSSDGRSPSAELSDGWGEGVVTGERNGGLPNHIRKTEDWVKGGTGELTHSIDTELIREMESTADPSEQQRVENHLKPAR